MNLRFVWSRQLLVHGPQVRFIRSTSATPFGLGALSPRDWSSPSSLTSANVSHLTSPQPEKRKVAGSIPALATEKTPPTCTVGGRFIFRRNPKCPRRPIPELTARDAPQSVTPDGKTCRFNPWPYPAA